MHIVYLWFLGPFEITSSPRGTGFKLMDTINYQYIMQCIASIWGLTLQSNTVKIH